LDNLQEIIDIALKYQLEGNIKEAEKIYKTILEKSPDNPYVLHYMGLIFSTQGKHELAIQYISRAISINPDILQPNYNLGLLFYERQNLQKPKNVS